MTLKERLRGLAEEYLSPFYAGRKGHFVFDWGPGPIPGERPGRTYDYSKILDNLPLVGDPEMSDQQLIDLLDRQVVEIKFIHGPRKRVKKLMIKLGLKRPPSGEHPERETSGAYKFDAGGPAIRQGRR